MARQTRTHRTTTGSPTRDLFLAGIGAVSLGRKQVTQGAQQAAERLGELRARADELIDTAQTQAAQWQQQAGQRLAALRAEAQDRLQPVLTRFGVAAPVKRRATRKAPARKRRARRAA